MLNSTAQFTLNPNWFLQPYHVASSLLVSLSTLWLSLQVTLPGPLGYIPFLCRLTAFILLLPFALCIALDIIAYTIARTLHLSMSQTRVSRSSPVSPTTALPSSDQRRETTAKLNPLSHTYTTAEDSFRLDALPMDRDIVPTSSSASLHSIASLSSEDTTSSSDDDSPATHFDTGFPPMPRSRNKER